MRTRSKTIDFPVLQLNDPRLATIRGLIAARDPHVILAPFLTAAAKRAVESAGWGWLDTSGSVHIESGDTYIHIERSAGRNATRPGRLVIPPQGERIVRFLLDEYPKSGRISEVALQTRLDKGYTSRMLKRLRQAGLVSYARRTAVEVTSPAELFEFWRTTPRRIVESSWFVERPSQIRALAAEIQRKAGENGSALTGVFAAGLLTARMEPEAIECYVSDLRTAVHIGQQLGGERVERGRNVTFLSHRDPGILTVGASRRRDYVVASISQIYRDAIDRARGREVELASELRRRYLKW